MDFEFTDEQETVRELARGILEKEMTPERIRDVVASPDEYDTALWATLAEAGLLGLSADEELGGMGFGYDAVCILLAEIGRVVAPVPVIPTLAFAAPAIAKFGTADQRNALLTPLISGEAVYTTAFTDPGAADFGSPGTTAKNDGGTWVLDGRKSFVPAAGFASRILVPAKAEGGVGIFLVSPGDDGVTLTRSETSTGEALFDVVLDGVRVDADALLGGEAPSDSSQVDWMLQRALVGISAMQVGVSEKALEITADYVREREQFGVPIGSFQAVQHRSADCFIDLACMRWVTWRAAWKLAQEKYDADEAREAAVAKFWAAEGGTRIANAAQHLHGGIGVDVDYPIHRYFISSKALELSLGGAAVQLDRLGRDMARGGAAVH